MKRSPMRVVELCAYTLIIIAAIVWMLSGGELYNPPGIPPPVPFAVTQTVPPSVPSATVQSAPTPTPPPVIIPKGEIFPE